MPTSIFEARLIFKPKRSVKKFNKKTLRATLALKNHFRYTIVEKFYNTFLLKDHNYHVLINLGFEDKEDHLYLALLELGKGTVLQIARKTKVNRASIYYIMEKMKKRGWVTHLKKAGKESY